MQVAYANEFQEQQSTEFGVNGLIMTPGFCGVGWNITTDTNNNCNSMGRFTVLTMLKVGHSAWQAEPGWWPADLELALSVDHWLMWM